jgi:uncharacterized protein (DUF2062 family)
LKADSKRETRKDPHEKGLLRRIVSKLLDIVRQKDPPHKIALGLALGIFVGFLPIMGIQMVVVSLIALPLRANLKGALVGVWMSNPLTFIPLYYGNYLFGRMFLSTRAVGWKEFAGTITHASDWSWTTIRSSLANLVDMGSDILLPLWVGSAILAVLFSIPVYFFTYRFVITYRARRAVRST